MIRRNPGLRFQQVIDRNSQQGFLALTSAAGEPQLLANLSPLSLTTLHASGEQSMVLQQTEDFVRSRAAILVRGEVR